MKYLFVIIILNFIVIIVFGKDEFTVPMTARSYRQLKIDTLFFNGNYRESLNLSLQEIDIFPTDTDFQIIQNENSQRKDFIEKRIFRYIIRGYTQLHIYDSAYYWIDSLLKIKQPDFSFFLTYEFEPLFKQGGLKKYYQPTINAYKKVYPDLNEDYFIALIKIFNSDQLYTIPQVDYMLGITPTYKDKLREMARKQIHNNLVILDSLITLYGFPTTSNTTDRGPSYAFFPIQHTKDEIRFKLQDKMDIAFKNNEIEPYMYAMYIDRNLIYQNCPQRYGTQFWYNNEESRYYFFPFEIDDFKTLNKLREEVDLGNIENKMQELGMEKLEVKEPD